MAYYVIIAGSDPHAALLECARNEIPGLVLTEDCESGQHCHAVIACESWEQDETLEALERWYERGTTLIAVYGADAEY